MDVVNASKELGVDERTIWHWLATGKLVGEKHITVVPHRIEKVDISDEQIQALKAERN